MALIVDQLRVLDCRGALPAAGHREAALWLSVFITKPGFYTPA